MGCSKGCKSHNLLIYILVCGEREGSGHLYKIIKDLYQIISKLSEHQEVTDIIWFDILFIDNLGSNTPWKKMGQAVGQKYGVQKMIYFFV